MTRSRGIATIVVLAMAIAGCSGAGGYGGAYGGNAAAASPAAPSIVSAPSMATAAPASASSGSPAAGGDRYDYSKSSDQSPSAADVAPGQVVMSGLAFEPRATTVAAGANLALTNRDTVKHIIVEGKGGTPASSSAVPSAVEPGQTVTVPLPKAGVVDFTCTIHPSMNLTVTVTP